MEAAVRKYLLHELETLQEKMLRLDKTKALMISRLPASQQPSASNLLHYLQLRNHDIRPLQEALHHAGLSSIDSSESHILYQVEAIMNQLGKKFPSGKRSTLDQTTTRTILQERTVSLFGPEQNEVIPHIMVTFDIHFAEEPEKVRELLTAGMQVARINCAHDDPKIWAAMIENVRAARQETGLPCPIYMDLAGP
ncbi:MAG: pyruvate kinase, partial [Saprospiraceae bacterium]